MGATAITAGFSATIELEALAPLVELVQRRSYDAELRVRPEDGGLGLLRYTSGELAAGVFDGASGARALERLLALRSGAVELEVFSPETALPPPAPCEPVLQPLPLQATDASPAQVPPWRRVEATSAFVEPLVLRSWLWALAPGLALALWLAVELAARWSPTPAPLDPGTPAAASASPRPGAFPE